MFQSIGMQKTLTRNCVLAVLFFWIFAGASAIAGDTYGTYRLDEKDFVTVAGIKYPVRVSVWKKNKDIIQNASYKLKLDKNNRRYARIEHDNTLQDRGGVLAGDYSQKKDGRKVLGVYRLDQQAFAQASGKVYKNNVFVWLKRPEAPKQDIKLVKSGNTFTIVHVDRRKKDQQGDQIIQLADKSTVK